MWKLSFTYNKDTCMSYALYIQMVQLDHPEDWRTGTGMKNKSCCATKQLGIKGERQRPEFNNSHKFFLRHLFGYDNIRKRNRQKFLAVLVKYCITVHWIASGPEARHCLP